MNNSGNRLDWLKFFLWPLLWLEAAVVTYLNWDATAMTGLISYYENYARIIRSGFDSGSGFTALPTFPMWGYGWVMLLLRTKLAIVVFQQVLAMFAVWAILRMVSNHGLLSKRSRNVFLVILLLAPGWFALHSVLWPNSIFASLLTFSLLLLAREFCAKRRLFYYALAGILFGTALNFRSDFLLLPIGLAVLLIMIDGFRRETVRAATIWLAAVCLMLIPWAAYTRAATGHVLLTSTNGGHVFFIGLGNLPGNKWRIQADDRDSVMHRVLEEKLGKPAPASVSFKADSILKQEFLARVSEDPAEYLRKAAHNAGSLLTKGSYAGEFYEVSTCKPDCSVPIHNRGVHIAGDLPQIFSSSPAQAVRTAIYLGSELITRIFVLLSYLLLPFTAFVAIRRKNLLAGAVALTIAYQSLLSIAGYFMPAYTSMIYLVLALNIAIGGTWLLDRTRLAKDSPAL